MRRLEMKGKRPPPTRVRIAESLVSPPSHVKTLLFLSLSYLINVPIFNSKGLLIISSNFDRPLKTAYKSRSLNSSIKLD